MEEQTHDPNDLLFGETEGDPQKYEELLEAVNIWREKGRAELWGHTIYTEADVQFLAKKVGIAEADFSAKADGMRERLVELESLNASLTASNKGFSDRIAELEATIGELPDGAHPDELKPRDVSFMKERQNALSEAASLREHIEKIEAEKETLTGKVASLTEEVAALKKAAKAKTAKPTEETTADAPPATENAAA
jgi:predicted  nucleic acid-binding Zn-ribbon protein